MIKVIKPSPNSSQVRELDLFPPLPEGEGMNSISKSTTPSPFGRGQIDRGNIFRQTWVRAIICFFILLFIYPSYAFQSNVSNGISLGYIKAGSAEVGVVTWRPDLSLGTWSLGFDANLPLGDKKPEGFDSIVFRSAEYNDGQKGLRYGVLDNVTWGRGLLMKNYSTRIAGPITQNNQQTAIKGFFNAERVGVQFMSTWSHIYAVRLTEKVNPMLTIGQSYITDTDGPSIKQPDGSTINYPSVSGAAVDASVPLPLNFEGYAEAAQLINHGTATTIGINWGLEAFIFSAGFDAGYRFIDQKFVPGYFNADYETNPINLSSYEATGQSKDGYVAELKLLAANVLMINALYESYKGSNTTLTANAETEIDKIYASAYFKQPNFQDFRSLTLEEGAILGGSIGYKINPNMMLIASYKKAYDPVLGKVIESQFYEAKMMF